MDCTEFGVNALLQSLKRGRRGTLRRCFRHQMLLAAHRGEVDELLLRRVLYGISCRNYE